jgi:hypothetical protein
MRFDIASLKNIGWERPRVLSSAWIMGHQTANCVLLVNFLY